MASKLPALKMGQSHRRRPKWIPGLLFLVLCALVLPAEAEDRFRPVRGQLKPYVADADLALIGDQSSEESLKGEPVTRPTPFAGCSLPIGLAVACSHKLQAVILKMLRRKRPEKPYFFQDFQNQGQGVDAIGWSLMTGLNKNREEVHTAVTKTPYPSRRKASTFVIGDRVLF